MRVKDATVAAIEQAAEDANVQLINLRPAAGGRFAFTIRPLKLGQQYRGPSGRRVKACSWTTHGRFFLALMQRAPGCVIETSRAKYDEPSQVRRAMEDRPSSVRRAQRSLSSEVSYA